MNRRTMIQKMSHALLGVGATNLLPSCATTGGMGGGALPPATKDNPFVNSLGMKFVSVPGTKILMCTTETTVSQYQTAGLGYQAPKYPQAGNHPAVNVSWNDAKAWCKWLSQKEGRRYRLPSVAEWSAAAGGSIYPWGNQWPPPSSAGNYAGQEMREMTASERAHIKETFEIFGGYRLITGFSDRHKFTAPVGSYSANWLGIHDLGGNVWEKCEELLRADSDQRVSRGGSWDDYSSELLALSNRGGSGPDYRGDRGGFRCVLG